MERIPEGKFIIEYLGEVIEKKEENQRSSEGINTYCMEYKEGRYVRYIDARKKGNPSRFINHSCEPNAEVHRYVILCNIMFDIFV